MKKTFAIAILLASGSVLASTAAPEASWNQAQVQAAADQATGLKQTTRSVVQDDNRLIMWKCPWPRGGCIFTR